MISYFLLVVFISWIGFPHAACECVFGSCPSLPIQPSPVQQLALVDDFDVDVCCSTTLPEGLEIEYSGRCNSSGMEVLIGTTETVTFPVVTGIVTTASVSFWVDLPSAPQDFAVTILANTSDGLRFEYIQTLNEIVIVADVVGTPVVPPIAVSAGLLHVVMSSTIGVISSTQVWMNLLPVVGPLGPITLTAADFNGLEGSVFLGSVGTFAYVTGLKLFNGNLTADARSALFSLGPHALFTGNLSTDYCSGVGCSDSSVCSGFGSCVSTDVCECCEGFFGPNCEFFDGAGCNNTQGCNPLCIPGSVATQPSPVQQLALVDDFDVDVCCSTTLPEGLEIEYSGRCNSSGMEVLIGTTETVTFPVVTGIVTTASVSFWVDLPSAPQDFAVTILANTSDGLRFEYIQTLNEIVIVADVVGTPVVPPIAVSAGLLHVVMSSTIGVISSTQVWMNLLPVVGPLGPITLTAADFNGLEGSVFLGSVGTFAYVTGLKLFNGNLTADARSALFSLGPHALFTGNLSTDYCSGVGCSDSSVCSGFGSCVSTDVCECCEGFFGPNCEFFNGTSCNDTQDCSPSCVNGVCDLNTLNCTCDSGFGGPSCEDLLKCSPLCVNGGCDLNTLTCTCTLGFGGPSCDELLECDGAFVFGDPGACSGHGNCTVATPTTTECCCNEGWEGDDCSVSTVPNCDPACINGGSCGRTEEGASGCQCLEGFYGDACESPEKGCENTTCINGICTEPTEGGGETCLCFTNWKGILCDVPKQCNGINFNDTLNVCSGQTQGTCKDEDCCCVNGFSGTDCEIPKAICNPDCDHGKCTNESTCHCDADWMDALCNAPKVCGGIDFNNPGVCNENGDCRNGVCCCDFGFSGDLCETGPPVCDPICANGGTCVDDDVCSCAQGFDGPTCLNSTFCNTTLDCLEPPFCNKTEDCLEPPFCNTTLDCLPPPFCNETAGCIDCPFCNETAGCPFCNETASCPFCNTTLDCPEAPFCNETAGCPFCNTTLDCPIANCAPECQNGGICVLDAGESVCSCGGTNFTGEFCEIAPPFCNTTLDCPFCNDTAGCVDCPFCNTTLDCPEAPFCNKTEDCLPPPFCNDTAGCVPPPFCNDTAGCVDCPSCNVTTPPCTLPCENGGQCAILSGTIQVCTCPTNFHGTLCELDVSDFNCCPPGLVGNPNSPFGCAPPSCGGVPSTFPHACGGLALVFNATTGEFFHIDGAHDDDDDDYDEPPGIRNNPHRVKRNFKAENMKEAVYVGGIGRGVCVPNKQRTAGVCNCSCGWAGVLCEISAPPPDERNCTAQHYVDAGGVARRVLLGRRSVVAGQYAPHIPPRRHVEVHGPAPTGNFTELDQCTIAYDGLHFVHNQIVAGNLHQQELRFICESRLGNCTQALTECENKKVAGWALAPWIVFMVIAILEAIAIILLIVWWWTWSRRVLQRLMDREAMWLRKWQDEMDRQGGFTGVSAAGDYELKTLLGMDQRKW